MKIAPVADVKARMSTYIHQCEKEGPVVITRNGKAVAVLIAPADEEEMERLILACSPCFQAMLRRSRKSIASGKGLSPTAFWKAVNRTARCPLNRETRRVGRPAAHGSEDDMKAIVARSQFYSKKPYWYWWDVWDERKDAVAETGQLVLVQKDTGRRTVLKADELLPLLTEDRRTSRCQRRSKSGKGNWGLLVRPHRPGEVEVEAGRQGISAILRVHWQEP